MKTNFDQGRHARPADLVARLIDALNHRDTRGVLSLLSEDVAVDRPDGSREIGRESLRWGRTEDGPHGPETYADVVIFENGNRAAAEFTVHGRRISESDPVGRAVSLPGGMFFDIDGGRISRITEYRGRDASASAGQNG